MGHDNDITAWIAFFLGLYALAAGAGEWRAPGGWRSMLAEIEASDALQFLVGPFCLLAGAAIYLANPWRADDWLAMLVTILGGLIAVEGLAILAIGERFTRFARTLLDRIAPDRGGPDAGGGALAGAAVLVGAGLVLAGMARL